MESFKESVKEIARLAVFAAVGAIIASVLESLTKLPQTQTTVILTFAFRLIDEWVHESSLKAKGIVPF